MPSDRMNPGIEAVRRDHQKAKLMRKHRAEIEQYVENMNKLTWRVFWLIVFFLVALAFLFVPVVRGDDIIPTPLVMGPKAVMTGPNGQPLPEEIPLGEMLVISAESSVRGDKPKSIQWIIKPPERAARAQFSPDNLRFYVGTGKKSVTVTVILIASKGDESDWQEIDVKLVGEDDPAPGPTPEPNPGPQPTPNTFKAKLIDLTGKYPSLPPPERPLVAAAFRAVADNIDSISDKQTLLKLTADGMTQRIGLQNLLVWLPWRDAMTELVASEKLPDIKAHAAVWRTVADVLEGK